MTKPHDFVRAQVHIPVHIADSARTRVVVEPRLSLEFFLVLKSYAEETPMPNDI